MDKFPKYPTDFVAMTRPFEDDEIKKILDQETNDTVFTIGLLKIREVNATNALQSLKMLIQKKINEKEKELLYAAEYDMGSLHDNLAGQIKLLNELLLNYY